MFQDREHAGRLLAARLEHLRAARPVVLGLSRGGIPVAYEVARLLGAPLDLVVVRKIHAPGASEVVLGVLAEGGETFLDPTAARERGIEPVDLGALAEREVAELWRRIRIYRGDVPAPSLAGRTVVVVDDFLATGTTARAAARAARQRGAVRVALAVPVMSAAVEAELARDLDEVVTIEKAAIAEPPSASYWRLEQVTDETVREYLRRADLERRAEEGGYPAVPP
jgi:putative phosphoribosyl transferase